MIRKAELKGAWVALVVACYNALSQYFRGQTWITMKDNSQSGLFGSPKCWNLPACKSTRRYNLTSGLKMEALYFYETSLYGFATRETSVGFFI